MKLKLLLSVLVLIGSAGSLRAEGLSYFNIESTPNAAIDFAKYLKTDVSAVENTNDQVVDFKFYWDEQQMIDDGQVDLSKFKGHVGRIYIMDGLFEGAGFSLISDETVTHFELKEGGEFKPGSALGFDPTFSLAAKRVKGDGNAYSLHVGEELIMRIDFTEAEQGDEGYQKDFSDVVQALANWQFVNGEWKQIDPNQHSIRVGLHAKSLPESTSNWGNGKKSDKFLNTPLSGFGQSGGVPEPATMLIWGAGLAAAAYMRRRRAA